MKNKITIASLMFILMFGFISFAQQKIPTKEVTQDDFNKGLKDWFQAGDIIVELSIKEGDAVFIKTKGEYGYYCGKAKIVRVLKGNIQPGYINVNINHPQTKELQIVDDGADYSKLLGNRCVVRIKMSSLPKGYNELPGVYVTEEKVYKLEEEGFDEHKKEVNGKIEVYNSTKAFYKILHDCCNVSMSEKKSPINEDYAHKLASSLKITTAVACNELFISEYLDGQGSDNAVEIYNPTDTAISLANYKLLVYHNASLTPTSINLTGTISAFGTHVVGQTGASSYIISHSNQTTSSLNFNGNVVTALTKSGVRIDNIGEIGVVNTAGNWTLTPSGGTNNTDVRRKYTTTAGDTSWTNCKAEWDVFSQDSIHNLGQHSNLCSSLPDPDVLFGIFHTTVSSGFLDFDVQVSTDASTPVYLVTAPLHFQYDTIVFGSNIVANNKITVTNGPGFSNSNYQPANQVNTLKDLALNEFEANVYADLSGPVTLTQFTNGGPYLQLMHIRIAVRNCYRSEVVQIVHTDSTAGGTYYYNNSSFNFQTDNPFLWDNVNPTPGYSQTSTTPCYTSIDFYGGSNPGACYGGLADAPILPVNGSQIQLIGENFGQFRGKIYMEAADNGPGHQYIKLDNVDIPIWNDTIIEINVPSGLLPTNPSGLRFPGTGNIYVKPYFDSDSAVTPYPAIVSYSVLNFMGNTYKKRLGFTYRNVIDSTGKADSSAYKFRFDQNTLGNPTVTSPFARELMKKAIQNWACSINIRYRVGTDTSIVNGDTLQDGISYISFNNNMSNSAYIAQTRQYALICNSDFYVAEADISFLPNSLGHWYYVHPDSADITANTPSSTTVNDFFTVALHEMGHGSLIKHVNSTTDLMYYAPTAGAPRGDISPDDQAGGLNNVAYSKTKNYNSACLYSPINIPANGSNFCTSPTSGIEKIGQNSFQITAFPNPTSNLLNVTFIKNSYTSNTVKLMSVTGEVVYYNKVAKNEGANEVINVGELAKGIYLLIVTDDNNTATKKIIVE